MAKDKAHNISIKAPSEKVCDVLEKMHYEEKEPYVEAYRIYNFLRNELHRK